MSRKMEDLKDMICRELDEIADKGELSAGDVDMVYKLVVAKEKLLRTEEIEDSMGYSQAGDWTAAGTYGRRGHSYNDMSYNGNSYGRHYVRGHYSRDNGDMRSKLEEIMNSGELNGSQRQTLQKLMNEM